MLARASARGAHCVGIATGSEVRGVGKGDAYYAMIT